VNIGITCYPTYGGSGIVATELGMELAARGYDVHFISYANPIRLDTAIPRIHYHEVEVSNYPLFHFPPYCLALASRMAEVAECYHLDLLHVHYAIPHSIAAHLAKEMLAQKMTGGRRLPFVTTLHGTDITLVGMDRSYFPITRFSIEQSDGITAISEYLRNKTIDVFNVSKPVEVIHNFVNCDLYRPGEKRAKRTTLLHISNFRPVKRVLDCVRILREVRKSVDARLLMAGDGPDRGPAEMLAHELGVSEHIDFLGKRDHIERLIPEADVLLLPSEIEAFGLAALEAMACAVPPIATRTGGTPELITHGVDGFLEAVGEIEAQSARAVELLTDDVFYARISAAARKTAETRYCTSRIIPVYERMYERIAG